MLCLSSATHHYHPSLDCTANLFLFCGTLHHVLPAAPLLSAFLTGVSHTVLPFCTHYAATRLYPANLSTYQIGQSTQSGAGSNTNTGGSAVAGSSQCSVVQKRIGFRTVELVRDPLEKAVKDLFGDNRGFNFTENPKFVNWSILFQQEGWQWALDANGQWRSFPGNRSDVRGCNSRAGCGWMGRLLSVEESSWARTGVTQRMVDHPISAMVVLTESGWYQTRPCEGRSLLQSFMHRQHHVATVDMLGVFQAVKGLSSSVTVAGFSCAALVLSSNISQ